MNFNLGLWKYIGKIDSVIFIEGQYKKVKKVWRCRKILC